MQKQLHLLSYEYPNQVRVRIGGVNYTYQSTHFWCQKFLSAYDRGGRFNALSWFKRVSKVVEKEVSKDDKKGL